MQKKYAYFNKNGFLSHLAVSIDSAETREYIDVTDVKHKFNFKEKSGYLIWREWEVKVKEPTAPIYNLEEEKLKKIQALHAKYQNAYDTYLSQYPKREIETFIHKQNEALAYKLDKNAPTPVIDAITKNNATYKEEYVQSVLVKVTYLAEQEGEMVAIRDAIKACKTKEELEAIDV